MALTYEQWCDALAGERLPAAVIDLAALDRNIALVAEMLKRHPARHTLRLATKSVRVPALIRRILDYGPPYQGLMCYAPREAAFLAEQGFDDLLIAYPSVQPADLALLRELHDAGKTVRMVVDSHSAMLTIDVAMTGAARPFPVVLDVDMSLRLMGGRVHLGVRRSPLRGVDDVLKLYDGMATLRRVEIVGLMGYEAQVAGLGDRNPFKRLLNPAARVVRGRSVKAVARLRQQLAEALIARGARLELFNGGGTGSLSYAVTEPWLTELTAGSGFLCSHLFDYYSNVSPEPAAFFALQVTRSSDAGYFTCAGGGYIASGEPGWDKTPRPYLPRGYELVAAEGCGEVQTPLRATAGAQPLYNFGDPFLFRHAKAGELAEHFTEYLLVRDSKVVDRVPTYRGLGQCFL